MKKTELENYYEKRLNKLKKRIIGLIVFCCVFILLGVFFCVSWYNLNQADDLDIFYENLEIISKNCNSLLIVKCMSEEGWCVFSPFLNNESDYNYVYTPIENCLLNSKDYISYDITPEI